MTKEEVIQLMAEVYEDFDSMYRADPCEYCTEAVLGVEWFVSEVQCRIMEYGNDTELDHDQLRYEECRSDARDAELIEMRLE